MGANPQWQPPPPSYPGSQPYGQGGFQPPPGYVPPPAAPKSNLVRNVLLVLGGLFLVGLITFGAGIYIIGTRVKRAAEEVSARTGVELGDFTEGKKGNLRGAAPCSFLSAAEASQTLGVTVERAENQGRECHYFMARQEKAQQPSLEEAAERLKEAKGDAEKKEELERMAKIFVNSATDGSTPYVTIQYDEDGQAHMAGTKIAAGAMGEFTKVHDVGEQAILGPLNSFFVFLKNGVAVQIDLRQIPDGRAKAVAMGKIIASRL
jgi:hypothetical protein